MQNSIEIVIESRAKDLAGMPIERVLPWAKKRMVGPFIFLDHMGPAHFDEFHNMTVNAHPHIGLSTLTYLFQGRIHHKDSLGSSIVIIPGEVNWMTAGRGISHSEKTPKEDIGKPSDLHGLQFWVALPDHLEDCPPSFFNFKKNEIPNIKNSQCDIDVVVGEYQGQRSPVKSFSPMIFLNIKTNQDFVFEYQNKEFEYALYLIEGSLEVEGASYSNHEMVVFKKGPPISVKISKGTHCVFIGGEAFPNPKFIWWNFVSSSKEKMTKAKESWNAGNFPQVPEEVERIMAPEGIP